MGPAINPLAKLTAAKDTSNVKKAMGYQYAADKWTLSGPTPQDSDLVSPKIVMECEFVAVRRIMRNLAPPLSNLGSAIEVNVLRVHVEPYLRLEGYENRIDTDMAAHDYELFRALWAGGEEEGAFEIGGDR